MIDDVALRRTKLGCNRVEGDLVSGFESTRWQDLGRKCGLSPHTAQLLYFLFFCPHRSRAYGPTSPSKKGEHTAAQLCSREPDPEVPESSTLPTAPPPLGSSSLALRPDRRIRLLPPPHARGRDTSSELSAPHHTLLRATAEVRVVLVHWAAAT